MSGHSKWHNIQAKKGKADKARSNAFTKLGRMITMAAQTGGGDPDTNFSLRLAIEKARTENFPKDNIERAIKRGTGELKDAAALEEVLYEGFGPGGVTLLIEVVTDNKNRSVSEIKNVLSNNGGSLGGPGSVKWQFERLGVVRLGNEQRTTINDRKEEFELKVIEAGAQDIKDDEDGMEITCAVENFQKVLEAVQSFNIEPDESGLEWAAKESVEVSEDVSEKVENLYEALQDLDDVREVYVNF